MSRQKIYPHETQEADRGQDVWEKKKGLGSFQPFVGIERGKKGELLLMMKKKTIGLIFERAAQSFKWEVLKLVFFRFNKKKNGFDLTRFFL